MGIKHVIDGTPFIGYNFSDGNDLRARQKADISSLIFIRRKGKEVTPL
jgi:hypothetical protein